MPTFYTPLFVAGKVLIVGNKVLHIFFLSLENSRASLVNFTRAPADGESVRSVCFF